LHLRRTVARFYMNARSANVSRFIQSRRPALRHSIFVEDEHSRSLVVRFLQIAIQTQQNDLNKGCAL
jgi:uncharacterized protein YutE (UPF0331/DUF86 family)